MRLSFALLLLGCLWLAACADSNPSVSPEPQPDMDGRDMAPDQGEPVEDMAPPTADRALGATCTADAQCITGRCAQHPEWPSGSCTTPTCEAQACAEAGGACLTTAAGDSVCAKSCSTPLDCRFGYSCAKDNESNAQGCLPNALVPPPPEVEPQPLQGAPDGSPCDVDADCAGKTCLTGEAWPGGFCTTRNCGQHNPCKVTEEQDHVQCMLFHELNTPACLATCASTQECRPGYVCELFDGTRRTCLVRPQTNAANFPFVPADHPVTPTCESTDGGLLTVRYNAVRGPHALVALSPGGFGVTMREVKTPTTTLNPNEHYRFHLDLAPRWMTTLILPTLPAMRQAFVPGEYEATFATAGSSLCWYVAQHEQVGQRVTLNIVLLGQPQITQPSDMAGLQEMVDHMNTILAHKGLTLEPRIISAPQPVHATFEIIRDLDDLNDLGSALWPSMRDVDPNLSLTLALVRGFTEQGLLGISPGLPGPPGLHGVTETIVFASYGDLTGRPGDSESLATTVLHELGHNLGMRHTSEAFGGIYDPFSDTPTCRTVYQDAQRCADRDNLMFPFNMGYRLPKITDQQDAALRDNPLFRP